jgi:hypothetical protein
MPLDKQSTTLRQSPYFDDYAEESNYHRVLFKPSVAVQARELTQLQTILQNQIERFGDNIYQTGTIIKGCSLITDSEYHYVKLFDLQPSGDNYSISALVNTFVVESTSNLHALTVNYAQGGQQLDPDLNTLYLKYLNTGTNGEKTYSNNSVLTSYHRDYRVESIRVVDGGTLYSNSDVVGFVSNTGSGASAQIITYANGTIRSVNVVERGSGYVTVPDITITSTNGSGASLNIINYLAQVQVANSVYTSPVGRGTAIKTSDGVIYQKGHFIRVAAHETILSKYNITPSNVAVGFVTSEAVVNSNSDQTLLDNAGGTTNFTAPGADRLKLTANLVALSTANAASNNEFLSLYEYQDGRVVKDRTFTQYNSINKELARRTYEESGNYVVNPFTLYSEGIVGNTSHLSMVVGAGVGYVEGGRVEIMNNTRYPIRKATDTATDTTQTIATNYGGYVMIKEYMGTFDVKNATTIALYNDTTASPYGRAAISTGAGIGAPSGGVQIGTARVRSVAYDSGVPGSAECTYRMYLFDVQMSPGYAFRDVRTAVANSSGVADIIWDSALGYAVQYDTDFDRLVFETGTFAVQQLDNEVVIARTSNNTGSFTLSGDLSISLGSGVQFPYEASSTLNTVQERDFIVVPSSAMTKSSNNSGTITVSSGANTVTGTGTLFTTEYTVGQYIKVGNTSISGNTALITRIISNTSLQVATNWGATWSGNAHHTTYPANVPIDFAPAGRSITTDSTRSAITVSLGHPITATAGATIYHDAEYDSPAVRVKSANTYYVKVSNTATNTSSRGPWCLGIPDVVDLIGVYVGTGTTYANTSSTNYRDSFVIDSGQTDNFYGLASLKIKPGASVSLTNKNLLVVVKAMTHGVGSYISTESYSGAIDDVSEPLPANKIRTQDIPVFVSPKTGKAYDLRNVIDFRPICSNTAVLAANTSTATIDPSSTVSFAATDKKFPSPTRSFTGSVTSYLARRDRIIIDKVGSIRIVEGTPSNSPSVPVEPEGCMTIGVVNVPSYPSLSAKEAADSGRPDLGVYVLPQQNRRYTMKDISDIEGRISRLEYYTLLNTLETSTKQMVLPGEANSSIERFKNGFFVDPMTDYNVSNLQDPEYKVLIDTVSGIARPYFSDARVDLKFNPSTSTNVSKHGDHVLINYSNTTVMLSQPTATKDRTLVDQYWRYVGNLTTVPSFDSYYDIANTSVSVVIDLASPLNNLAQATSAALSQLKVNTNVLGSVNAGSSYLISQSGLTQTWRQNVNTALADTKVTLAGGGATTSNATTVDILSSLELQQYIRDQRVHFVSTGLRPGARHYVYFDGVHISDRAAPATVDLSLTSLLPTSFVATGAIGSPLVANSMGVVAGFIDIPKSTYFVGERSVVLMDVDNVESEASATSRGFGKFTAYAFSGNRTNLSISTKTIDVAGGSGFSATNYLSATYYRNDHTDFNVQLPNPDPLAQTFKVQSTGDQTDGVFITGLDVYFKAKDATQGVTIEIRETNNGVPASVIVPFSRVYKTSSQVSISNNASVATTFNFETPVYLRAGNDYAIVLYPDANTPEYRVFTARVGYKDLTNANLTVNQNWGLGTLFYSTSGSVWTPVQDEDLKFTIRRAKFEATSGTAVLNNSDYEFLTITNASGAVRGGEAIAQLHPNNYLNTVLTSATDNNIISTSTNMTSSLAAGDDVLIIYGTSPTVSSGNVTISSTTVTNAAGQSTSFTTDYSNGSFIKLGSSSNGEIRQIVSVTNNTLMTIDAPIVGNTTSTQQFRISPLFQVAKVLSANSSTITLNKAAAANTTSTVQATIQKAVAGTVDTYDYGNNIIYINNSSSANDTFKFFASNSTYRATIIGDTTQAKAEVSSIDNVSVNFFKPFFSTIVTPGTSLSLTSTFTLQNTGTTDTKLYELGMLNKLSFNDNAVIKSRSNEIVGSVVTKSFAVSMSFSSSSTDTSPVLDVNPVSVITTRNLINNDTTNETTRYGNAVSKYISKRLSLTEGMDAEDVKVFLTAYKPTGTNVDVYAKVLNFSDGELFEDKDWTLLDLSTSPYVYSDSLNDQDYREYEYTFPATPPSLQLGGVGQTYSNTTITGSSTAFDTYLAAGDFIKVVKSNTLTDYDVLRVASANSSTITTTTDVSFTSTGCTIEKVTQPKAAFKYCRNNNIVRYHGITGAAYDTYKYMAIKIVLRSPYNYLVPTVNDVRALAVSV